MRQNETPRERTIRELMLRCGRAEDECARLRGRIWELEEQVAQLDAENRDLLNERGTYALTGGR